MKTSIKQFLDKYLHLLTPGSRFDYDIITNILNNNGIDSSCYDINKIINEGKLLSFYTLINLSFMSDETSAKIFIKFNNEFIGYISYEGESYSYIYFFNKEDGISLLNYLRQYNIYQITNIIDINEDDFSFNDQYMNIHEFNNELYFTINYLSWLSYSIENKSYYKDDLNNLIECDIINYDTTNPIIKLKNDNKEMECISTNLYFKI